MFDRESRIQPLCVTDHMSDEKWGICTAFGMVTFGHTPINLVIPFVPFGVPGLRKFTDWLNFTNEEDFQPGRVTLIGVSI